MSASRESRSLTRLLGGLTGGSVRMEISGNRLLTVNADEREVELDLDPLLPRRGEIQGLLHEEKVSLWKNLGVPRDLARMGWRVRLRLEQEDVLALGRGTSPMLGHVHLSRGSLKLLRREHH
jgi:hypothetical protein